MNFNLIVKFYSHSVHLSLNYSTLIQKKVLLFFKLWLYNLCLIQSNCRLLFYSFFFSVNWLSHTPTLFKKHVYQVLKSPHIHKKAQDKFLYQILKKTDNVFIKNFYFNKRCDDLFFNLFFFICSSYISSHFIKLQKIQSLTLII